MKTKSNNKYKLIILFTIIFFMQMSLQSMTLPFSTIIETNYLAQPYDIRGLLKATIYLSVYILAVMSISLSVLTRQKTVAFFFAVFFSGLYAVDIFTQVMGSNENGISIEMFSLMIQEYDRAGNLLLFAKPLFIAVLVIAITIFVFYALRYKFISDISISGRYTIPLFIIAIAFVSGAVANVFSIRAQAYPAPIKALSIAIEYALDNHDIPKRILDEDVITVNPSEFKNIVWIIDESISGKYLGINNYPKNTTPFLNKMKNEHYIKNLGIVPSISNCSGSSNLLLRIGLTSIMKGNYEENSRSLPTIYQFAKRANFETHLIDAQAAPGQLLNLLTTYDLSSIDQLHTFDRTIFPNKRDEQASKALKKLLDKRDGKQKFIVVVKWGAHWPYHLAYPKNQVIFSPAVDSSYVEMSEENREIMLNSYLNAVRYSVDYFLQNLMVNKYFDNEDNIAFYTADHGQAFEMKGGKFGGVTHCHQYTNPEDVLIDEYQVPLIVFTQSAKELFNVTEGKHREYAQEHLFSTTLKLMGYAKNTYEIYGPTLYEGSTETSHESFVLDTGKRVTIPF